MRRRITTAIVGVTAFVLLALGIPLAVVADRYILGSEVVELQATAAQLLTEINLPINTTELTELGDEKDAPPPFGIYDPTGQLIYGDGPQPADSAVLAAAGGSTTSSTNGQIVVATPITDRDENIVAVLRVGESLGGADSRARRTWLVMAAVGAVALLAAWVIARRVASRLSRPVSDLAAAASQLGHGGVLAAHEPTGIAELDLLGTTLADSSQRIQLALARERRFSADVSHQLRTPLAGLRLRLEAATPDHNAESVAQAALGDLARLEQTVTHLLAFARDAIPASSPSSLDDEVTAAMLRWSERAATSQRAITVSRDGAARVRASQTSIEQILDVLIDNALTHGEGTVQLVVRSIGGGAAVDVIDEGSSANAGSDEEVFQRGHGTNNGIGLSLARSIADADGGRLLLIRRQPTTFSLIFLAADDSG